VIPALLVSLQAQQAPLATEFASSYALAIICFVSGSWWGMAQASGVRATLWLSNAYLLLGIVPGETEGVNAVCYLLQSRYLTGKTIALDGGRHLARAV
jgi:hypothetical protein